MNLLSLLPLAVWSLEKWFQTCTAGYQDNAALPQAFQEFSNTFMLVHSYAFAAMCACGGFCVALLATQLRSRLLLSSLTPSRLINKSSSLGSKHARSPGCDEGFVHVLFKGWIAGITAAAFGYGHYVRVRWLAIVCCIIRSLYLCAGIFITSGILP